MTATPEQCAHANRLCAAIYERHPCGCCWHIVLDDGNVDDDAVAFCARNVGPGQRPMSQMRWCDSGPCVEIAPILTAMSPSQRTRVRCDYSEIRT